MRDFGFGVAILLHAGHKKCQYFCLLSTLLLRSGLNKSAKLCGSNRVGSSTRRVPLSPSPPNGVASSSPSPKGGWDWRRPSRGPDVVDHIWPNRIRLILFDRIWPDRVQPNVGGCGRGGPRSVGPEGCGPEEFFLLTLPGFHTTAQNSKRAH